MCVWVLGESWPWTCAERCQMCFLTIYVFVISLKSTVHNMLWHLANQTGQKQDIIFSYHLNHRLLFITIEWTDYIYRRGSPSLEVAMLHHWRDPEGTNLARLRAFRVLHGRWKLPGLEDEEGERVAAVFPAKQHVLREAWNQNQIKDGWS